MIKTEIIPVIHMLNESQVLTNVRTCIDCGIKKVFIINHRVSSNDLIVCALNIKKKIPDLWVGINILDRSAEDAMFLNIPTIDGLWCDSTITIKMAAYRNFNGMLFGGLAFKYQPQPKNLKDACEEAISSTDVATTSGPGTGKPADIQKIKDIREYLGTHPMAIASGVSVDNISQYSGLVDYLLVASSITTSSEMIVKEKLLELKNKL